MNRYEKYKRVDLLYLEKVPEHWEVHKAKYFEFSKKEINKSGLENNVLSLTLKGVINNSKDMPIGLSPKDYNTYQIFDKNDLVFKLIDLNNVRTSRVGLVHEKGIMSSAYIRAKFLDKHFNVKYLYYWYMKLYAEEVYNKIGSGVRETLSKSDLLDMTIPMPQLKEQKQIAKYLDWKISEIDSLIKIEREKIQKILELKKKIISKTVTRGIINGVEFVDIDSNWIKKIPKNWKIERLKYHYKFIKGLNITKENLIEEGVAVFNYGQIHSKRNKATTCSEELYTFVDEMFLETDYKCLVKKGDFIFADTSEDVEGAGNFVYIDNDADILAGYHTIILCSSSNMTINGKYLAYLFLSDNWRAQIWRRISGIKVFSITQNILKGLDIIIPSIEEQEEIVKYLDNKIELIDNIVQSTNNTIEQLETMKNSLISEVVTGKIDVRNVSIPDYKIDGTNVHDDINLKT